ncbi:sugar ABC transporter substrate-binding protein [Marinomonas sp. 15G1-11]|uniref:Sugar ABC transporter substrate-binding protein n=1 Tax=Marinomonas phaeophyticola TaxID=3004091 RepID=A0ABT4JYR8_9GAMM|nr:sugar ABC transporter substrate-binding protein [Marinomonas sp. 15G1-11]MCZ2723469.1 sugar ABC transporter substrate-binding protein [Marinomonas sp. 15G1-11]
MKKLLALLFSLTFVMNSATAAEKITIGLAVDQLFESRVAENDAIKDEAAKRGYSVIEVVADGDAQTQNQQIQSLITQGVKAILVCAVDQNTIERALMAADRAGIAIVAYDRSLAKSRVVDTFVGPDSLADGRLAGAYTAKQLAKVKGEKVIVELIGALNDQNGIDRSKGFREAIEGLDNVKLIEVPTDWDSARALSGTQNAFQANPIVHSVFAATDTHIPSVETVLTDLGKLKPAGTDGHVVITGINGSLDGYQATSKGIADGIVVMNLDKIGRTAVDLAEKLINGETVERRNVVSGNFYTTDNIQQHKDAIWGAK